jgi:hypothetical protein
MTAKTNQTIILIEVFRLLEAIFVVTQIGLSNIFSFEIKTKKR